MLQMMLTKFKSCLLNLEPQVKLTKKLTVELMMRRKCEKFKKICISLDNVDQVEELSPETQVAS
jgi:hypothetical protein